MQINVTFRHIEPSPPLRDYTEDKISRIKKYLKEPIEAHVVLKVEKFRHIAEATIDAGGSRINATEETEDMYSAIDKLADTLEGQAKKNKEKSTRHKGGNHARSFGAPAELAVLEGHDDEKEARIIRVEQVHAKPMDVDEAVMQLKLSNGEFMVFNNRDTHQVNVLYRRKDGHFGLIETLP